MGTRIGISGNLFVVLNPSQSLGLGQKVAEWNGNRKGNNIISQGSHPLKTQSQSGGVHWLNNLFNPDIKPVSSLVPVGNFRLYPSGEKIS